MNRISKQLIKIGRQIQLFENGQRIASVLKFSNFDNDVLDKASDNPPQTEEEKKQVQEKAEKAEEKLQKMQSTIQTVRKAFQDYAAHWDKALQHIFYILRGQAAKEFPDVIKELSECKQTKKLGKILWNKFNKVSGKLDSDVAKWIKSTNFNKFKETVDDEESGFGENIIDPFCDMYNDIAVKFKKIENKIQEKKKQKQRQKQQLVKKIEDLKVTGQGTPEAAAPKVTKKYDFRSNKIMRKMARELILISQQLKQIQQENN